MLPRTQIRLHCQQCRPISTVTPCRSIAVNRGQLRREKPLTKTNVSPGDVEPVPPAMLQPMSSVEDLEAEAEWVGNLIRCWLNEEWTVLQVHYDLGAAVSREYYRVRRDGFATGVEVGDVILGLSQRLLASFDFGETFVNAFEVSNKVAEFLMIRAGHEVCCASPADLCAIKRYEGILRQETQK